MEARAFERGAMSDKELASRIAAARESRGVTLAYIANAIGISRTVLSQFVNNGVPIIGEVRPVQIELSEFMER